MQKKDILEHGYYLKCNILEIRAGLQTGYFLYYITLSNLWMFPMMVVVSLATTLTLHINKSILPAFVKHLIANFPVAILGILALFLVNIRTKIY